MTELERIRAFDKINDDDRVAVALLIDRYRLLPRGNSETQAAFRSERAAIEARRLAAYEAVPAATPE